MSANEIATTMSASAAATCEVKIGDAWQAVTLSEARMKHGNAEKRCPACHGKVTVTGKYVAPFTFTLAHRRYHQGCPLSNRSLVGEPRPHPEALA